MVHRSMHHGASVENALTRMDKGFQAFLVFEALYVLFTAVVVHGRIAKFGLFSEKFFRDLESYFRYTGKFFPVFLGSCSRLFCGRGAVDILPAHTARVWTALRVRRLPTADTDAPPWATLRVVHRGFPLKPFFLFFFF
jgi:hypothetical protein